MNEAHLIDLDQPLPGLRRFISCWVLLGEVNFIVDPGPPSTAVHLIAEMEKLGVEGLDFVLLTHIHLDHGGATALLLERWPEARVVCQKRGRQHLVDPERLWEGSLQVLGREARVFGEPAPVPEAALVGFEAARERGIEVILTPGHAPHHISFVHDGDLFLGEAAGTFSTVGRGETTDEYYLRPATPPRFFRQVAEESIDRLLALDPFPRRLCFAHHGRHAGDGRRLLENAKRQFGVWLDVIAREAEASGGLPEDGDDAAFARLLDAVQPALMKADEFYARWEFLPEDIRERERHYTGQSLRGMVGYLRAQD